MRSSLLVVLALSFGIIDAYVLKEQPQQTAAAVRHEHAIYIHVSEPTAAPMEVELKRRQAATQKVLLGGNDNTCGFYGGERCMSSMVFLPSPVLLFFLPCVSLITISPPIQTSFPRIDEG